MNNNLMLKKWMLMFAFSLIVFSGTAQNWNLINKAVATNLSGFADFGCAVSISGDYAIIGAQYDDLDEFGGNQLGNAGSAYIFKNIAGTWTQIKKIVAADRGASNLFGYSVSMSGDYAVIAALGANAAYIFYKNEGGADNWGQVKKIVAADGCSSFFCFGRSVSISGDYVIIGANVEFYNPGPTTLVGAAYIFYKNQGGTNNWGQQKKIIGSDCEEGEFYGCSVSISGDYAIVGAKWKSNAGAAYIYYKNEGEENNWGQIKKITAAVIEDGSDFGSSVSLSGDYLVIGAELNDYDANGGNYMSVAGSAYIFYKNQGGTDNWGQVKKIVATDREASDGFGFSVGISGDYIIVGAPYEDHDANGANYVYGAGSAYIFYKNEGGLDNWGQVKKIHSNYRTTVGYFGCSVALSDNYTIVGVPGEDYGYGAAYVFTKLPVYNVFYNGNGNTNGVAPVDAANYFPSANVTIHDAGNLEKTGYTFIGWNTKADGTGTSYTANSTMVMPAENVTLYAQWNISNYTITYNTNGGTHSNSTDFTINNLPISLSAASKTGYTFDGWYDNAGFNGDSITQITTIGNKELWAKYTITTYTITYNANGGAHSNPATFSITDLPLTLTAANKDGYTFDGWYDNAGFNGSALTQITSIGNKELWAKYSLTTYIIIYNTDSGIHSNPGTFTINDLPITLTAASKEGYIFNGWYDNAEFTGSPLTQITTTGNQTLYAKFTALTYTITYNVNGGTHSNPATYTIANLPLTLTAANKNGYTFDGWYDNAALTGNAVTQISTIGNKELWAKYTITTYTITYNANGGAHSNPATFSTTDLPLTLTAANIEGYDFNGWYENSNFTGNAITQITTTGNKTLYAKFTATTYSIIYNASGGTHSNPITFTITDLPISLTAANKDGYTFDGWYDNAGFNGSALTQITSIGNKELWAKYTITTYTITYNANGGAHLNPATFSITDLPITLTSANKDGYTFDGWFDNTGFTGNPVIQITTTGNKTLYAKFTATIYSIIYNASGGTHSNPITFTITNLPISLTAANKDGYTFDGWYDNAGFNGSALTQITSIGNKELWAKFTEITYTVIYNTDGATHSNPSFFIIENLPITLTAANKPGYTFDGWFDNAGFTGDSIIQISTIGNKELWAKLSEVGITEINDIISNIFPNPTSGKITIDFNYSNIQKLTISNALGKEIITKTQLQKSEILDLSDFTNGIYFIIIITDKGLIKGKIVKE